MRKVEYTIEWDSRPALSVGADVLDGLLSAFAQEAPGLYDHVLYYDSDTGAVGGVCQVKASDASKAARQATLQIDTLSPAPLEALTIYRTGDDN